jgi:hypothetical protein
MKIFYILTLIAGLLMLVAVPDVRSERPQDLSVALVLSQFPTNWTITLDQTVTTYLHRYDVKVGLITALEKRRMYEHKDNKWFGISGIGVVVFSIIGIIRERRFRALKKQIESQKPC